VNKLRHAKPVTGRHRLDPELARGEIAEESHFGIGTQTRCDKIADLGDYKSGHHEDARMGEEQLKAGFVVPIIGIDVGVERPGINDQGYGATSLAKMSSTRSEMSFCPLRPAAAAPRALSTPRWACTASRVNSEIVIPRRCASWRSSASVSSDSLTVVRFMYASILLTQALVRS